MSAPTGLTVPVILRIGLMDPAEIGTITWGPNGAAVGEQIARLLIAAGEAMLLRVETGG